MSMIYIIVCTMVVPRSGNVDQSQPRFLISTTANDRRSILDTNVRMLGWREHEQRGPVGV